MTIIRTSLAAAAVIAILAGQASAQTGEGTPAAGTGPVGGQHQMRGPGKAGKFGPGERLNWISARLHLTDEQKAQIKPILDQEIQQMKAIRTDKSLSRDQRRGKTKALREETFTKIHALLTPEQQKKHEQMRQRAMEKRQRKLDKMQQSAPQPPAPEAPKK